jgi:CrcB protein
VGRVTGVAIWFWMAVAGGAGAVTRFAVDGHVLARTGGRFPFGTALVNLTGAFVLGAVAGAAPGHQFSLVVGTGFIGAYTTFSTWMLETMLLGESGRAPAALVNAVGQIIFGVALAGVGFAMGMGW